VIAGVGAAFVQSVLPVLLIGGLGYLVGRARAIDLAPITGLTVRFGARWASRRSSLSKSRRSGPPGAGSGRSAGTRSVLDPSRAPC
jgi:hypothetical protein